MIKMLILLLFLLIININGQSIHSDIRMQNLLKEHKEATIKRGKHANSELISESEYKDINKGKLSKNTRCIWTSNNGATFDLSKLQLSSPQGFILKSTQSEG